MLFSNLFSIQAISIFKGNVCSKNHFSLVTFFHAICLLSKRFFSDESEKVWKSAETNTKIHLKDMVLVDDLCLCYFRWSSFEGLISNELFFWNQKSCKPYTIVTASFKSNSIKFISGTNTPFTRYDN